MKKLLSLFISIIMLFSVLSVGLISYGAVTKYTYGNYTYTIVDASKKTCEIYNYTGSDSVVDIPTSLGDYKVVSLYSSAFSNKSEIEVVNIPSSIETINAYFRFDKKLAAINVDENNANYSSIDGVLYNKDATVLLRCPQGYPKETFVVPSSVKTIGAYAFYYDSTYSVKSNTNLNYITIPEGVETISTGAFSCSLFKQVVFPDSVTSIGNSAFSSANVSYVYIGKGVRSIGNDVFCSESGSKCDNLKSIEVSEDNTSYFSQNGVLFGNDGKDLIYFPYLKSCDYYKVPDGVETIKNGAFNYIYNIKELDLNNVSRVENYALWNIAVNNLILSPNLESIKIQSSKSKYKVKVLNQKCIPSFDVNQLIKYEIEISAYDNADVFKLKDNNPYSNVTFNFVSLGANPIVEHKHDYLKEVVAPDCENKGYTSYTCRSCDDIKYEDYVDALGHDIVNQKAVESTCTVAGMTSGSYCARCEKVFEYQQVTDLAPHNYNDNVVKATLSKNGTLQPICVDCGVKKSKQTISRPKSFALSKTAYTYNTKNISLPTVKVLDYDGQTISASNYNVSYISRANDKAQSSIKAIGQYKAKIDLKNNYSGTKYLYFSVKPRNITIITPSTTKNTVIAKWKQDTSVTGYQAMIATDKNFTKNVKTVIVSKNSTINYSFKKLIKNKKYYVKVRSYKTITCDGKKAKMYSSYTAEKSIVCK